MCFFLMSIHENAWRNFEFLFAGGKFSEKALDKSDFCDIIQLVTFCKNSERLPMRIDLSPVLGGETDELSIDYPLTINDEFCGVTFPKPVRVLGTIKNNAGYIALKANAEVRYDTVCDRCLTPISTGFSLDFEKTVALSGTLENEDGDDYLIAEDRMLELDEPLLEAIVLEFPTKHLCSEDCKGLCPKCGRNLNEGFCACVIHEIDPRMAGFAKLLEKNK